VTDGTVGTQAATVPDTVSGAAITAAIVTLTDTLALTSQAAAATSNTATYTFQSDVALAIGTTLEIVMPNFAGTATVAVGTCVNGGTAPTFTVANTGTGATYKVTLTTATAAIVVNTDCAVTIGALTNPASSGAPAYTVAVTDGTVGTQAATVPDTVSGASINIAITGGATQTIEKGAAVAVTGMTSGNFLCWKAGTSPSAVAACAGVGTATDVGTTGCGAVDNAAPVWTTLTNDDVSIIECTGTNTVVGTAVATVLTEANIAITGGAAQDLVAGAALAVTELGSGRHLCWTAAATATAITACTAAATANDAGTSGCGAADDASLVWTTVAGTHVSIIQCEGETEKGSAVATVLTEQIVVASQNITAGSIVTVAGLTTGNHLCWTAGTVAGAATCAAAGTAADLGVTGCGAADDNTIAWTTTSKDYIAIRECTGTNTNVGAEVDLVLGVVTTTAAPAATTTVSGASSEAAWSTMLTVFAIAMAAFSTL
jgi:hypothetical protein